MYFLRSNLRGRYYCATVWLNPFTFIFHWRFWHHCVFFVPFPEVEKCSLLPICPQGIHVHFQSMIVPCHSFCEPQLWLYSPMQEMSECVNIMLPVIAADTVHTGEFTPVINCSGVHLQPAHQFKRTIVWLMSSHPQSQTAFKPNLTNPNKPHQQGILQSLS